MFHRFIYLSLTLLCFVFVLHRPINKTENRIVLPVGDRELKWNYDIIVVKEPTDIQDSNSSALIGVATSPKSVEQRNAIRETWGVMAEAKVVFIMGRPSGISFEEMEVLEEKLVQEQREFNDIVQFDFMDTYENLTLKTVCLFSWAHYNTWKNRSCVVKADDDVIVNVDKFKEFISTPKQDGIYGNIIPDAKPSPIGKYHTIGKYNETSTFQNYPNFTSGPFYFVSEAAVHKLHKYLFSSFFIRLEDLYLTGVVAENAGIHRHHMSHPMAVNFEGSQSFLALPLFIACHRVHPSAMKVAWHMQKIGFSKYIN